MGGFTSAGRRYEDMTADERPLKEHTHGTDATLRVRKSGVESVSDELDSQLRDRELVKVTLFRAARGDAAADELAIDLAERAGAELSETRPNTATSR